MRTEHLWGWLREYRKTEEAEEATEEKSGETEGGTLTVAEVEENTEATETTKTNMYHWKKVVALLQASFQEGRLAEEATWQAVALINKRGRNYRCIGLVEVVLKVVTVILSNRFTTSINFHAVLHGFRAGRGTGTAPPETKLLQKSTYMR